MGYINGDEITIDAILTKKGREHLAAGSGLNITQFALGDDEIDYSLYEPAHPKGSAYYDAAIKAIPITEASPDETQVLRYKLVTLPKGTVKIPKVEFGVPGINVSTDSGQVAVTPTTSPSGNKTMGYTLILANKNAGTIVAVGAGSETTTSPVFLGDEITSTASIETGETFVFIPNPSLQNSIKTTLTVYGNETGGSSTIPVSVTSII